MVNQVKHDNDKLSRSCINKFLSLNLFSFSCFYHIYKWCGQKYKNSSSFSLEGKKSLRDYFFLKSSVIKKRKKKCQMFNRAI